MRDRGLKDRQRILYLGGSHDPSGDVQKRFGEEVEVVKTDSGLKALAHLAKENYAGVYVDADYLADAVQARQLLLNTKILQAIPDAIALLDTSNTIVWENGRLKERFGEASILGRDFYEVLCNPEILGPEFQPLTVAINSRKPCSTILRCEENRYYELHVAPVVENGGEPEHLIVTVHDVTELTLQQQKLKALHKAGIELADLTPDEVASMTVQERIDLLKSNILHFTKDLLHYNVVEIRVLDQSSKELLPLLVVGFEPAAAGRRLFVEEQGSGVTGFVAATGKGYICDNTKSDPHYLEGVKGAISSLTVPLIFHDKVIGTFNVESQNPSAFGDTDMQFLEMFARDVAVALNTLEILAVQHATSATKSVEAIHKVVAGPVDEILNDAVNVLQNFTGQESAVVNRLRSILRNARDIKLVIQEVGHSLAPLKASPKATRPTEHENLEGSRILVVDEEHDIRASAHSLLEKYGCIVETAHDGEEAILMVRNLSNEEQYDVIISDISLPDMRGHHLMEKLEKTISPVPLILMTGFGYDPGHAIVKARQRGLKFVLYKPFRLDQLLNAVEKTLLLSKK